MQGNDGVTFRARSVKTADLLVLMASTGVFVYTTSSIWLIAIFAALTVYSAIDAVRHWGD